VKANQEAFVQIGEKGTFELVIIVPQLFKRVIVCTI